MCDNHVPTCLCVYVHGNVTLQTAAWIMASKPPSGASPVPRHALLFHLLCEAGHLLCQGQHMLIPELGQAGRLDPITRERLEDEWG